VVHTPGPVRLVTRAKYAISLFNPVQGRVPAKPMPILFVAATISVNSRDAIVGLKSASDSRCGRDMSCC